MKRLRRRARLIPQLEVRMERREVQRHVRPKMRQNPFGKFARFRGIIIQRRNHQVRNFKPHVCFFLQPFESLEHRLQMRQRGFSIKTFRERFEIDIGSVDVVINVVKSLVGDVPV